MKSVDVNLQKLGYRQLVFLQRTIQAGSKANLPHD